MGYDPRSYEAPKGRETVERRIDMALQLLIATPKGKQALKYYKEGQYDLANISEMQFALVGYAAHVGALRVTDSLKQYGTVGTQALEESLSEGLLKPYEGENVTVRED